MGDIFLAHFGPLMALFHCMVRYGMARYGTGTAQFGSVCISTAV